MNSNKSQFGFLWNWGMRSKQKTIFCSMVRDPQHLSTDISPRCLIRRSRFRTCLQFLPFSSSSWYPTSQLQTQPWPSLQQEPRGPSLVSALDWVVLLHGGLWWNITFTAPYSLSSSNDVSPNQYGCDSERKAQGNLYKPLVQSLQI